MSKEKKYVKPPKADSPIIKEAFENIPQSAIDKVLQFETIEQETLEINQILENILYWETCPENYKVVIRKHLEGRTADAELREAAEKVVEIIDDSTALLMNLQPDNIELKVIYNACSELEKALKEV